MPGREVWSDDACLHALEICETRTAAAAAEVLSGMLRRRVTRNAVIGLVHRIKVDTDRVPDTCRKPENCDGGMPRCWWQDGIKRRQA